jgi:putative aldouronate transport system permease protein
MVMREVKISLPVKKRKRTGLNKMKKVLYWWDLYILLLPAVIVTFIFSYIPMYGVQIAFKDSIA